MSKDLYVIFTDPADAVGPRAHDDHDDPEEQVVDENLEVPGIVACRRYGFRNMRGDEYPARYRSISVYEVDGTGGDPAEGLRERSSGAVGPDRRDDLAFSLQRFTWLEGELRLTDRDQLIFVFTVPPTGMTFDAYDAWYPEHIQQNIRSSEHIEGGWRYGLAGGREDDREIPTHCAVYALEGSAEEMLVDVNRAVASGATGMLDGFHVFSSFEATALGPRRSSP